MDGRDPQEPNWVLYEASGQRRIEDARTVFKMARALEGEERPARALLGCAAVLLTTGWEQSMLGTLGIDKHYLETQLPQSARHRRTVGLLSRDSGLTLRQRMMEVPVVRTDGRLELIRDSRHLRALHDLITCRNELVHGRAEDYVVLDVTDGSRAITRPLPVAAALRALDEYLAKVSESGRIMAVTVASRDAWEDLTAERLGRCFEAVEEYLDDCLPQDVDDCEAGELLRVASGEQE